MRKIILRSKESLIAMAELNEFENADVNSLVRMYWDGELDSGTVIEQLKKHFEIACQENNEKAAIDILEIIGGKDKPSLANGENEICFFLACWSDGKTQKIKDISFDVICGLKIEFLRGLCQKQVFKDFYGSFSAVSAYSNLYIQLTPDFPFLNHDQWSQIAARVEPNENGRSPNVASELPHCTVASQLFKEYSVTDVTERQKKRHQIIEALMAIVRGSSDINEQQDAIAVLGKLNATEAVPLLKAIKLQTTCDDTRVLVSDVLSSIS